MRSLLVYSFYLFGIIFIIYEMLKFSGFDPLAILKSLEVKAEEEKKQVEELKKKELPADGLIANQMTYAAFGCVWIFFSLVYMGWTLVGLLSSQWLFFLVLIGLSILTGFSIKIFKNYKNIIFRFDAFITFVLLIIMYINRFHIQLI